MKLWGDGIGHFAHTPCLSLTQAHFKCLFFYMSQVATILTFSRLEHRKHSYSCLCIGNLFLQHLTEYIDLICLVSMVISVLRIYLFSFYLFVLFILLGITLCILSVFCVSKKLLLNLLVGSMAFCVL